MNIYRVESGWSTELIVAKSIGEAIAKYEKFNRKVLADEHWLIEKAEFIGEAK